jgi:hypothetical protein
MHDNVLLGFLLLLLLILLVVAKLLLLVVAKLLCLTTTSGTSITSVITKPTKSSRLASCRSHLVTTTGICT